MFFRYLIRRYFDGFDNKKFLLYTKSKSIYRYMHGIEFNCISIYFKKLYGIIFSSYDCSTFNLFNALKEYLSRHHKILKIVDE